MCVAVDLQGGRSRAWVRVSASLCTGSPRRTQAAPQGPSTKAQACSWPHFLPATPVPPPTTRHPLFRPCLQALSRASSLSRQSSLPISPTGSGPGLDGPLSPGVPAHPRLEAALASIKRSPAAAGSQRPAPVAAAGSQRPTPAATKAAPAAAAPAAAGPPPAAPELQQAPDWPLGSGLGSHRLLLPPAGNDFEPDFAVSKGAPPTGGSSSGGQAYPSFQPPSPISLMPRYEPPSPSIDLRPHPEPRARADLPSLPEPPSPITLSLAPRRETPSPEGQLSSPPQRPYAGLGRTTSLGRWEMGPGLQAVVHLGQGWRVG